MKLLLLQHVPGTGAKGEVVSVPDGFARNFLLPKRLASPATSALLEKIKHTKELKLQAEAEREHALEKTAETLSNVRITVVAAAHQNGHLFGTVTPSMVVASLHKQGKTGIDETMVHYDHPIDHVGDHPVHLQLSSKHKVTITVSVTAIQKP